MRQDYNHPEIQNIVSCNDCGKTFQVCYNTYRAAKPGKTWLCKECMKKLRAARIIARMQDPEYMNNLAQKRSKFMESLSDEEKERRTRLLIEGQKKWFNSLTENELKDIRDQLSKNARERWNVLSDSEKAYKIEKLAEYRIKFWNSMNPEERSNFVKRQIANRTEDRREEIKEAQRERWNNKSESEKNSFRKKVRQGWKNMPTEKKECIRLMLKERYQSLSDEEKQGYAERGRQYWDNLSAEEKLRISEMGRTTDSIRFIRKYYQSLSPLEKELFHRSTLKTGNSNRLTRQFERLFAESILSDDFRLVPETIVHNGSNTHAWDYGVYSGDSLIMVVDVDGSYFHGDKGDYDGLHSKEEYDESRTLSVPDGIMFYIILEDSINKCFADIVKLLGIDYNEFIENIFRQCRRLGFPDICYTDKELLRSYESLCKMNCNDKYHQDISLNTRLGDRLIQHFHHSIWHAHVKGKPSPYDAWKDDELLRGVIKNRTIYQNHLNPNKILQGFNVSKVATKVSVFSAGRAKLIINKYLSEYDTIFDPFSGFSGRMLGAISLGKRYIGQDINISHVNESMNMIQFLNKNYIQLDASVECIDTLITTGTYPCLFTCPPYKDKEIWKDTPESNRSCDEWIDICLERFKCDRYVFVVDETKKYRDHIRDVISNKSHLAKSNEFIIVM